MSANNQSLIKEHKGKYYVFINIQAESWSKTNTLYFKDAKAFDNLDDAYKYAIKKDAKVDMQMEGDHLGTEYGLWFNKLAKDDGKIKLI